MKILNLVLTIRKTFINTVLLWWSRINTCCKICIFLDSLGDIEFNFDVCGK